MEYSKGDNTCKCGCLVSREFSPLILERCCVLMYFPIQIATIKMGLSIIYSTKKVTSDFHGTISFDPIKMSQQKIYQNVYQTSDTQKLVII